jgi:hypothetical protein
MFAWLIAFEWLAAMAAASLISPHVWPAEPADAIGRDGLGPGGLIYLFPLYLALRYPGHGLTRHVIAVGQMLTPSLFIYLTGGGFETHFFIFGALASLASYRDIRILVGHGGGGGRPFLEPVGATGGGRAQPRRGVGWNSRAGCCLKTRCCLCGFGRACG